MHCRKAPTVKNGPSETGGLINNAGGQVMSNKHTALTWGANEKGGPGNRFASNDTAVAIVWKTGPCETESR